MKIFKEKTFWSKNQNFAKNHTLMTKYKFTVIFTNYQLSILGPSDN